MNASKPYIFHSKFKYFQINCYNMPEQRKDSIERPTHRNNPTHFQRRVYLHVLSSPVTPTLLSAFGATNPTTHPDLLSHLIPDWASIYNLYQKKFPNRKLNFTPDPFYFLRLAEFIEERIILIQTYYDIEDKALLHSNLTDLLTITQAGELYLDQASSLEREGKREEKTGREEIRVRKEIRKGKKKGEAKGKKKGREKGKGRENKKKGKGRENEKGREKGKGRENRKGEGKGRDGWR